MLNMENVVLNDRFKVLKNLFSNSTFTVFTGIDLESEEKVFLKFFNSEILTHYEIDNVCFMNELGIIKSFEHPNIIPIYEVEKFNNTFCIISEYLEGQTLEQLVSDGTKLRVKDSLRIISHLASALGYADNKGILHRSVKSSSICIIKENDTYRAKLFDFGMSYITDITHPSVADNILQNFGYMSPEATGLLDRPFDSRSDLYSLGIVLYEMLTGVLPFTADSIDTLIYKQVAASPLSPKKLLPDIPDEICDIVMKLINKEPDLRYQNAYELINDIDRYLSGIELESSSEDEILINSLERKSRLISRSRELKKLKKLTANSMSGSGKSCLVHGTLGQGKSDLIENYCNYLKKKKILYFFVSLTSQNSMTPYYAFQEILNSYMQVFRSYNHKTATVEQNRLTRLINGFTDIIFRFFPYAKQFLPESAILPVPDSYDDQIRTLSLLSSFFLELYPEDKPYVICIENMHYADSATITLINEMMHNVGSKKVFIICSFRDGAEYEVSPVKAFFNKLDKQLYDDITLKPYTESYMTKYLSELLNIDKDNCQILSSYFLEKTDGNPYFTANILRSMLEDNIISIHDGILEQNWELLNSVNEQKSILQMINSKMKCIHEDTISLLNVASVIGLEFSLSLLMFITDLSREETIRLINEAIGNQFLEYNSVRDTLEFSHKQIHEAFLSHLSNERKRELHYWIGKAIETQHSNALEAETYRLVYHFTQAHNDDCLRTYIMKAADMARKANANEDAIIYYTKAVELFEKYGDSSVEFRKALHSLTELNLTVGNFENAISSSQKLFPLMTDSLEKARLQYYIGRGYFHQCRLSEGERIIKEALSILDARWPVSSRYPFFNKIVDFKTKRTFRRLYRVNIFSKNLRVHTSPEDIERAKLVSSIYETLIWIYGLNNVHKYYHIAIYNYNFSLRKLGISREFTVGLSSMASYYMMQGKHKLAEDIERTAINLRRSLDDTFGIGRSYFFLGMESIWKGENSQSLKLLSEAYNIFSEIGDSWELSNVINQMAIAHCYLGEFSKCIKLCNQAFDLYSRSNHNLGLCTIYATLSLCYIESGNYPLAEKFALRGLSIVKDISSPFSVALLSLNYGHLLYETKKYDKAVLYFEEAKALYEHYGFMNEYIAPVYSYLAMTKTKLLDMRIRTSGAVDIASYKDEINSLCKLAFKKLQLLPNQLVTAYRACAYYNIVLQKYDRAENLYRRGLAIAAAGEHKYESAMIHYECGDFLANRHRTGEARYHIFEAYMGFTQISSLVYRKRSEEIVSNKYHEDFGNDAILANVSERRNRLNINRKVNSLLRLGERLTSTLEIEELQKKILQDAVELACAERGILFLYPETGEKELYVASVYNIGNFDGNTYDWILEKVVNEKKTIVINDVQSDEYRKLYSVLVRYGIKSVMATPMFVRGKMFGIIYLDSRLARGIFTDEYMETMSFIANQSGAPIENARLYHRAITDGLTGIYGRSYLDNLIIDKLNTDDTPAITALMLDIDNFKKCNDTYGHQFGDKVLKQAAVIMKRAVGTSGVVCRYGGEEFVVLLDTNDEAFVMTVAERIRENVQNTSVVFNTGNTVTSVSVTITIGVAIWQNDMERVELIEHADKALYYGKHNGKNQVVIWTPDID